LKKQLALALCIPLIPLTIMGLSEKTVANDVLNASKVNEGCLVNGWDKAKLIKLKQVEFELKDNSAVNQKKLAFQMLHCLANPDPIIRDGIAFESLSHWLRGNSLDNKTVLTMFNRLTKTLSSKVNDPNGVYLPFTALVLAEVARVDRKTPYLTTEQRNILVSVAVTYLTTQRDYRGFDGDLGWRHGIAHGADLMLQLALNPKIDKSQADKILAALASQITANNEHHYIYGEPKRLALPVAYIFLRGMHSEQEWQAWLSQIAMATPFENWAETYQSEQGLAKLSNTQNFLFSLYASIKPSGNKNLQLMIPALEKAIREVN